MSREAITGKLVLKPGRDKPLRNRHPWIFSGAVERVEGEPNPGELVLVTTAQGRDIAIAYYNPRSQIVGRTLADPQQPIDSQFWMERIQASYALRFGLGFGPETDSYRLISAESDQLPGLVVDRYGSCLVLQALTLGIDRRKAEIAALLREIPLPDGTRPTAIIEKSDASVRRKEGLKPVVQPLFGKMPTEPLEIRENGYRFLVDLAAGHKTGFYLDQRDNRALFQRPPLSTSRLSAPLNGKRSLLNMFAYTGGFAVYAAAAGFERIVNVDSSFSALEMAEQNVVRNHGERPGDEYLAGDSFEVLRHFYDEGEQFDVVVLDPPKFVHSKQDIQKASRGYKDINRLGMRLTRPGGFLLTFSCSGLLETSLFQKILFGAALDAEREIKIIQPLAQGGDHPISLAFPEGKYLKGFLCWVE